MDLDFLAQADSVALRFEKAKRLLESAKVEMESAKQAYDEVLAKAEELGIPKVKLKKLTEERVMALFETGMIGLANLDFSPSASAALRTDRPKKKKPKEINESVEEASSIQQIADEPQINVTE
jgi:hypothetical protein